MHHLEASSSSWWPGRTKRSGGERRSRIGPGRAKYPDRVADCSIRIKPVFIEAPPAGPGGFTDPIGCIEVTFSGFEHHTAAGHVRFELQADSAGRGIEPLDRLASDDRYKWWIDGPRCIAQHPVSWIEIETRTGRRGSPKGNHEMRMGQVFLGPRC